MALTVLRRVTFTRHENGLWDVRRERADGGESCVNQRDLIECFESVRAAYFADGSPRPLEGDE